MSKELVQQDTISPEVLNKVMVGGDLSPLTEAQRIMYYTAVCKSVGLNPLTKPFEYIKLNGKLVLYALRTATDQLRKVNNISITIADRTKLDDVYVVTAQAKNGEGRADESTGAVAISGLKGEALANALMKAETKAKRRVTLSICGLGLLDESEVETIRDVSPPSPPPKSQPLAPDVAPKDFKPSSGRYKGKALHEIKIEELADYVAIIEQELKRTGVKSNGPTRAFLDAANAYISEMVPDSALSVIEETKK